jgi:GTPase Era involved in 16S rRNA processing
MTTVADLIKIFNELTPEEQKLPFAMYVSGEIFDQKEDCFDRKIKIAIVEKDEKKSILVGNYVTNFGYIKDYNIEKVL